MGSIGSDLPLQDDQEDQGVRYEFRNQQLFRSLCGVADVEIASIESMLGVELIPRGHSFVIRAASKNAVTAALKYFSFLENRYPPHSDQFPEKFDREYLFKVFIEEYNSAEKDEELEADTLLKQKVFTTSRSRPIFPRTINQAKFVQSLIENSVTFGIGPAGTGKTFLSVAVACRMLVNGDVERIILTRPAVEAGESLGFLPGDLSQKVDPYLRPLYDALYECFGTERVTEMLATQRIEIAPLAYMRGRTLSHSFVILDEAQNCTRSQLKMFLTRLGKNSRMCLSGDASQVDLTPGKSGLLDVAQMLKQIPGIGYLEFGREDIIRNPLVERIVQAFENELE